MTFTSNEDYLIALRQLIERWCDERNLEALSHLLPGYLAFNGLADGWAHLHDALKSTRALGHEGFTPADWEMVDELIRGAERNLHRR